MQLRTLQEDSSEHHLLAVLTQVPGELYDAAAIDGCGILQRIRFIEIPTLAPTITILLILSTGGILSVGF